MSFTAATPSNRSYCIVTSNKQQHSRRKHITPCGRSRVTSMDPTSKSVSFQNSHINKLVGTLTLTNTPGTDSKCVILCHGYASFKDGFHLPALATALAEAGYNSLR
jgi:hypothetical protein